MKVAETLLDFIGNTPLLSLNALDTSLQGNVYGKCEFLNPSGSVKDRAALAMIETAEKSGRINKDTVIIEPTSGNTGVALAMVCAIKGYKLIITMPESMTLERRRLLTAYGVELHLTPAHLQMSGAIEMAQKLAQQHSNAFIPQQFENEANPIKHYESTGVEIWDALDGKIDVAVIAVGTGGTISGASKFLKEKNPAIQIVAVEPKGSPVLSGGQAGPHMIQGIGAGFVPNNCDRSMIDEILLVRNEEAIQTSRDLAANLGVLVGYSAGANVFAALKVAKRVDMKGKNIVTILCDVGERYLTTDLFDMKRSL